MSRADRGGIARRDGETSLHGDGAVVFMVRLHERSHAAITYLLRELRARGAGRAGRVFLSALHEGGRKLNRDDMHKDTITREQLVAQVKRLDKNISAHDKIFNTALFMLAAYYVGHDLGTLEALTGVSREFMAERTGRLRESGIWVGDDKTDCEWFARGGGLAFWLDVGVAEGYGQRFKRGGQG